jgi:predicted GH43/DUF377 family glycosyl hydrolase
MPDDLAIRTQHRLSPDPRRVITKLFVPGEETTRGRSRAGAVVERILALDESEVTALARAVEADFGARHRDFAATLADHFSFVARDIPDWERLTPDRRALIGACFTHEYSPEAAALCNPSMAAHPDQSDLDEGQLRFVMTVRCIGEGHISSIGFRTGILGPGNALTVDEPRPYLVAGRSEPGRYSRRLLHSRLIDLGFDPEDGDLLLGGLPDTFTMGELNETVGQVHEHTLNRERVQRAIEHVYRVASSSYQVEFPPETQLAERLLWPAAQAESHGMEDARLVRVDEDGAAVYYATYTAFDGGAIGVQLLTTTDFRQFRISSLAGPGAQNKGLALFPRRIGGRYFALSRWDRENILLVHSDDGRVWEEAALVYPPQRGWELIQVGNGGSPIETSQGWLVITHGVGPMRKYALGAILLDLDDPATVLATLDGPLLTPNASERDGYVPNVVYTCGALQHGDLLTIPYGISDGSIGFAQVSLPDLLGRMLSDKE